MKRYRQGPFEVAYRWSILIVPVALILSLVEGSALSQQGLSIYKPDTKLACLMRDGKPLLSFGCHYEHMFFRKNTPDYTAWSDWAEAHGINHARLRAIQPKLGDDFIPYKQVSPGQYDLTQYDAKFWDRLRAICVNLDTHGIVMHIKVFPHNSYVRSGDWPDALFNPANNVNAATEHLSGGNFYKFWYSVADGKTELWDIQRKAVEKLVDLTKDLDNVYYDISHEMRDDCCGYNPSTFDWTKAQKFIDAVADTIQQRYKAIGKTALIGLDAEHLDKVQTTDMQHWIFSNPKLNLIIKGNSGAVSDPARMPSVQDLANWRATYKKHAQLDEGAYDNMPISYHSTDRHLIRFYVWKFVMAKSQLIDIYQKEWGTWLDNYDPWGHNPFEDDALVLREFWDSLVDYPNLDFAGTIVAGPGSTKQILSSSKEAVAYMSRSIVEPYSAKTYAAQKMRLEKLKLADGSYTVDIWQPESGGGLVDTKAATASGGTVTIDLPRFTDDLVVHLYDNGIPDPGPPDAGVPDGSVADAGGADGVVADASAADGSVAPDSGTARGSVEADSGATDSAVAVDPVAATDARLAVGDAPDGWVVEAAGQDADAGSGAGQPRSDNRLTSGCNVAAAGTAGVCPGWLLALIVLGFAGRWRWRVVRASASASAKGRCR